MMFETCLLVSMVSMISKYFLMFAQAPLSGSSNLKITHSGLDPGGSVPPALLGEPRAWVRGACALVVWCCPPRDLFFIVSGTSLYQRPWSLLPKRGSFSFAAHGLYKFFLAMLFQTMLCSAFGALVVQSGTLDTAWMPSVPLRHPTRKMSSRPSWSALLFRLTAIQGSVVWFTISQQLIRISSIVSLGPATPGLWHYGGEVRPDALLWIDICRLSKFPFVVVNAWLSKKVSVHVQGRLSYVHCFDHQN